MVSWSRKPLENGSSWAFVANFFVQHRQPSPLRSVSSRRLSLHLDGNHKFYSWGFVIYGCGNGYSRLVMFLKCGINNRAVIVLCLFVEANKNMAFHQESEEIKVL